MPGFKKSHLGVLDLVLVEAFREDLTEITAVLWAMQRRESDL
jgi:hypothetical protein